MDENERRTTGGWAVLSRFGWIYLNLLVKFGDHHPKYGWKNADRKQMICWDESGLRYLCFFLLKFPHRIHGYLGHIPLGRGGSPNPANIRGSTITIKQFDESTTHETGMMVSSSCCCLCAEYTMLHHVTSMNQKGMWIYKFYISVISSYIFESQIYNVGFTHEPSPTGDEETSLVMKNRLKSLKS